MIMTFLWYFACLFCSICVALNADHLIDPTRPVHRVVFVFGSALFTFVLLWSFGRITFLGNG